MNDPSLLYTPESFTEVHLDNIGDQISNAILDAMLAQDPLTWRIELQVTRTIGEVETLSLADGTIGASVLQDQQPVAPVPKAILRRSFTWETSARSRFR